jgi:hypothetical protein
MEIKPPRRRERREFDFRFGQTIHFLGDSLRLGGGLVLIRVDPG